MREPAHFVHLDNRAVQSGSDCRSHPASCNVGMSAKIPEVVVDSNGLARLLPNMAPQKDAKVAISRKSGTLMWGKSGPQLK